MKFSEILSISGQSGLFKYLAQATNGIIVESLVDGKRQAISSTAKVSALIDISIYTEAEDMPLADIYQIMNDKLEGAQSINHKSSPKELVNTFQEFVPQFDRDRVHNSDLKKLFQWYNILSAAGVRDYNSELQDPEQQQHEEQGE